MKIYQASLKILKDVLQLKINVRRITIYLTSFEIRFKKQWNYYVIPLWYNLFCDLNLILDFEFSLDSKDLLFKVRIKNRIHKCYKILLIESLLNLKTRLKISTKITIKYCVYRSLLKNYYFKLRLK